MTFLQTDRFLLVQHSIKKVSASRIYTTSHKLDGFQWKKVATTRGLMYHLVYFRKEKHLPHPENNTPETKKNKQTFMLKRTHSGSGIPSVNSICLIVQGIKSNN